MFGTYIHPRVSEVFRKAALQKYGRDLRTPLEEALVYWAIMQSDKEWAECATEERNDIVKDDLSEYETAVLNRLRGKR